MTGPDIKAAGIVPRRLFSYTAGFFTQGRVKRMLALAGHEVRLGLPVPEDGVVVWGRSPYAGRGETIAARYKVPLIRVEDAFLRSIRPGRMGEPPMGLLIDPYGVHFDSSAPSLTEVILAQNPLDDAHLLTRARDAMARMQALDLSKYNMHDPNTALPAPGYVLVIDQTKGDASIRHSGASAARFAEMLALAQEEHPNANIVIKTHPETQSGLRPGHFTPNSTNTHPETRAGLRPGHLSPDIAQGRIRFCDTPVSPRRLLEGAVAVYTVSSQLGFEAILAGHRPVVLGQPFYAGWGLTDDRFRLDRRTRKLTRTQLFAGALLLAPTWYDPCRDRLCELETVIDQLDAEVRAFRADRQGYVAGGMRLWKRGRLQAFFGAEKPVIFCDDPVQAAELAEKTGRKLLIWAGKAPTTLPCLRVEDGFLRSRGLGAKLVPPISLVTDDLGIYYDPSRESHLDHLIRAPLPPGGAARAENLRASLIAARVSKYNLTANIMGAASVLRPIAAEDQSLADGLAAHGGLSGNDPVGPLPAMPWEAASDPLRKSHTKSHFSTIPSSKFAAGLRSRLIILVPGQVEDDASIRLGAGEVRTNLALLQATRAANPDAVLIYKPHPDVEANLRPGAIPADALNGLADEVAYFTDPIALIEACDAVWTMTSLTGFEALVRHKPVTCLGAPFYAGWGLTHDLGPIPTHRSHAPDGHPLPRPTLDALIHAALIAYPRYYDPVSRRPCPPEVAVERLVSGQMPKAGLRLRLLAKLQGAFASQSHLWRQR